MENTRGRRARRSGEKVEERRNGGQRRVYTYRNYSHYHWCQRLPALEGQDRSESTHTHPHNYIHTHITHRSTNTTHI